MGEKVGALYVLKGAETPYYIENFCPRQMPFKLRENVKSRAFANGGVNLADGMVDSLHFQVGGPIISSSYLDFFQQQEAIYEKLNREDYYLYWLSTRRLKINKLTSWTIKPVNKTGLMIWDVRADLLLTDPFFYYNSDDTDTNVLTCAGGSETFTITNDGNADAYPIVTIEDASLNCVLQNNTDIPTGESQGLKFALSTTGKFIVDCVDGTVEVGDVNYIRYFAGAFLKLLPGDNELEYTGDACTITVVHRRKFL